MPIDLLKWTEKNVIGWNPLMKGYMYLTTTERGKLDFTSCVTLCVPIYSHVCLICIYAYINIYDIFFIYDILEVLFIISSDYNKDKIWIMWTELWTSMTLQIFFSEIISGHINIFKIISNNNMHFLQVFETQGIIYFNILYVHTCTHIYNNKTCKLHLNIVSYIFNIIIYSY